MVAIARAIAAFEPTMVIISTLPLGVSRWLEIDLINRVRHHFEIPVEHLPAAASSENGDRAPRAGSSDRRVPRVLVVEDNPQDAELTLLALERTAVEIDVQVARSGASALELLRTQGELGFDLVLLDLKMPIVDGFGFLAQAAEIVGLEELAVVVLTTSVDDADRARANELGVLRFLQKDPDFVRFSDTLTHLLNELLA